MPSIPGPGGAGTAASHREFGSSPPPRGLFLWRGSSRRHGGRARNSASPRLKLNRSPCPAGWADGAEPGAVRQHRGRPFPSLVPWPLPGITGMGATAAPGAFLPARASWGLASPRGPRGAWRLLGRQREGATVPRPPTTFAAPFPPSGAAPTSAVGSSGGGEELGRARECQH